MEFSKLESIEPENEYEMENENNPLNEMKIIQIYNYVPKNRSDKKFNNYSKIIFALLLICFFILCIYLFVNRYDKALNNKIKKEKNQKINKNNTTIKLKFRKKPNGKKIGIAFYYPKLTKFITTTGDYLINTGKYNIYFLTSSSSLKKYKYNKNISNINAYYNKTLIEDTCKINNIEYMVINDGINKNEMKWLKSLGLRLIGVSDFSDINKKRKSPLFVKEIQLFDAFIQESINAYSTLSKMNFKNNIYIPKYFSSSKTNLTNHNILLIGKLDDEKNILPLIGAISLVAKVFHDVKLQIISPDSKTRKINQLVKQFDLKKNIIFLPFNKSISSIESYYNNSSIFLYTSIIKEFPRALGTAMSYGLPCIISDNIGTSNDFISKNGTIKIDFSQDIFLANELLKLFKDEKYRYEKGNQANSNIDIYNKKIGKLWERLFDSLIIGENEFQKFRAEVIKNKNSTFTKKNKALT
jgi:glycosyltransferase involved in cell wall biosynthesis